MIGCFSHYTTGLIVFRPAPSSGKTIDQSDGFSDAMGQLENNIPGGQTNNIPGGQTKNIPGSQTNNVPGDHQTNNVPDHDANYRFSIGQLPTWAKKQVHANKLTRYLILTNTGLISVTAWNEVVQK